MRIILLNREEVRQHDILSVDTVRKTKINGLQTIEFTTDNQLVEKYFRLLLKGRRGLWEEYIVDRVTEVHDSTGITYRIYAEESLSELRADFVENRTTTNNTAYDALQKVLSYTRWQTGEIAPVALATARFYRISALEALTKILEVWDCEVETQILVEGNKITGRFIHLRSPRGRDEGFRFAWTKDIESIERTVDESDIITALYGFGVTEEVLDANDKPIPDFGKRLDFAKINGGKMYVGDEQQRVVFGRRNNDGTMSHRFGVQVFDDVDDREKLLSLTRKELSKINKPHITYKVDAIDLKGFGIDVGQVSIGDTITVRDGELGRSVKARVLEMTEYLDEQGDTQFVLGNFQKEFTSTFNRIAKTESGKISERIVTDKLGNVYTNITNVENNVTTIQGELQGLQNTLVTAIATADGKNTIFTTTATPTNPKQNDLWFYPNGTGTEDLRRFENGVWVSVIDTREFDDLARKISDADAKAQSALTSANSATSSINTAIQNAGFTSLNAMIVNMRQKDADLQKDSLKIWTDMQYDSAGIPLRFTSLESKVEGLQTTVGNASSGLVSQFTQLDSGFSLLSSTVDLLQLERLNLVHNISGTQTLADSSGRTWTATGGGARQSTTYTNAVNGKDAFSVVLKADGWAQLASNYFKIDPSKAYRFSCWLRSTKPTGESAGADAFGLFVRANGSNNPIAITPVAPTTGATYGETTSPYFVSQRTLGTWKEYTGYLVPESISPSELKGLGQNVQYNFIMPSNATSACMRIVNSYNNVSANWLALAFPTVTEVSLGEVESQAQLSILNDSINLRVTKSSLISEINVQAGRTLIRASDNVLMVTPTTTYIADATIKSAHIANASITTAKIATIDASVANIININVNNLVSNKASFIQALFNGTNTLVKIDANGMYVTRTDGSSAVDFNSLGMIVNAYSGRKMSYFGISNTHTADTAVYGGLIGAYEGNDLIIGTGLARTGSPLTNMRVAMQFSYQHNIDVYTPMIFHRTVLEFDPDRQMCELRMNGNTIKTGLNGNIDMSQGVANVSNWIRSLSGTNRIEIGGDGETILKIGRGGARYLDAYAPVNMNGYSITGQSDKRLKKNITLWNSVLEDIREMYFARFEWIDESMPTGHQYGIIAQSAPTLSVQGEDGYLRIDSTKEVHIALKGVQELLILHDRTEERLNALEQRVQQLTA